MNRKIFVRIVSRKTREIARYDISVPDYEIETAIRQIEASAKKASAIFTYRFKE